MSNERGNEPAFPGEQGMTSQGWNQTYQSGLSTRDYMAIHFIQGMLANVNIVAEDEALAKAAYELADITLKIRGNVK